MTSPQGLPAAAVPLAAEITENENGPESAARRTGATVGASDADADAAASGADVDLTGATRDSDGVPVGEADAEADRKASGA
ncbi:hypothetical protein ACQP2F_30810 [Actinoplanes sp. CA-030573]|uniref:hypothetical protein n=1 Tax=Actinoplanes sp. CA-030573 TaxID=3239898 RepID=UPI003D8FA5A2